MPDVPAHDVLGVAPEMIVRGDDPPAPAGCLPRALSVATAHARGTVAEPPRRNGNCDASAAAPTPNSAADTNMARLGSLTRRQRLQRSTVRNSTCAPGIACA